MNITDQPEWKRGALLAMIAAMYLCMIVGCGAAGSPIAPEDVGLEAKIRKQQQETKSLLNPNDRTDNHIPLEKEQIKLPPLQPVGVR
ncbi:MAG: hypothetical protein ACPGYT_12560 [Nitrospirales bacterium]